MVLCAEEELQGEGPFDAIHVGAASEEVPEQLVGLLKGGGRMVLPLGPRWSTQVRAAG
jgi:protein-L-isoaspartate(D-aspartate) O-methyltransferase